MSLIEARTLDELFAVAKAYRGVLKNAGASIDAVEYPAQARALLAAGVYDLVITDYLLDAHTADQIIDEVRASSKNANTRILVISGNNDYLAMMQMRRVYTCAKPIADICGEVEKIFLRQLWRQS